MIDTKHNINFMIIWTFKSIILDILFLAKSSNQ